MNLYFIHSLFKFVSLVVVSFVSLFGSANYEQKNTLLENTNEAKNVNVTSMYVKHNVINKYVSNRPAGVMFTTTEGVDGYIYVDEETGTSVVLTETVDEIVEVGTGPVGEFTGRMTGYGPDCEGCSKVGNVSCRTKAGTSHSLTYDGTTYHDDEYGDLRILAATLNVFPCGTIVYVDNGVLEPFYGIVLDTGSAMRNAYKEDGTIWMDLAFSSEKVALTGGATSRDTKYVVQRWGW